jgi:FMN phosphatase YigB (HAD superfamily)
MLHGCIPIIKMNPTMVKTIQYLLLDLDGTLIKFDLNTFIQNYLRLIQDYFSHLPYASSVPEWILGGTSVMLNSVKTITNKEKYLNYFQEKSGLSESEIWEIFIHFYNTDYNKLEEITEPMDGAESFLKLAIERGYHLVLATQPVFPEIAIRKRLVWAGLEKIPFELITHIENMYASKPHRQYFDQILSMLNITGDKCLMIGNDLDMDMAAKNYGIPTFYLQTDSANPNTTIENADYRGDFKELAQILDI